MYFHRFTLFVFFLFSTPVLAGWVSGQAKVDITGPIYDTATMGYAVPTPIASGLHQRLYARAFVMQDDHQQTFFMIHTDTCFITMALKERVLKNLRLALPHLRLSHANLMIMASHTHSGPGGFSNHFYYNAPSKGMVYENFEILHKGITQAAVEAYNSRTQSKITWQRSKLFGGAKNRSILPFLQNPQAEREEIGQDTDPTFDQLQFYAASQGSAKKLKGVFNWFAAHATSMDKNNTLISGDNKGYAQYWLEKELGQENPGFVSAFANANGGDASPNIAGDIDGDNAWECAANENKACAEELGLMQAQKSYALAKNSGKPLNAKLHLRHQFVDFANIEVDQSKTCYAAVGISMLAGTSEDGQGVGEEGVTCSNGFGPLVKRGCRPAMACHGQKPVVIESGTVGWHPNVLPLQLVQIGQIAVVAVPSEFTTMAGHRLRKQLERGLKPYGVEAVVIAGYANGYSSYVTTEEEYALQHYEGASTLYGPKTLKAYQKIFGQIAADFAAPNPPETAAPELDEPNKIGYANFKPVRRKTQKFFGSLIEDVQVSFAARSQEVGMLAFANNPNFSVYAKRKMMSVELKTPVGWQEYLSGSDWNTELHYDRGVAEAKWTIGLDTPAGEYRIGYFGCYDAECLEEFKAYSSSFMVY